MVEVSHLTYVQGILRAITWLCKERSEFLEEKTLRQYCYCTCNLWLKYSQEGEKTHINKISKLFLEVVTKLNYLNLCYEL